MKEYNCFSVWRSTKYLNLWIIAIFFANLLAFSFCFHLFTLTRFHSKIHTLWSFFAYRHTETKRRSLVVHGSDSILSTVEMERFETVRPQERLLFWNRFSEHFRSIINLLSNWTIWKKRVVFFPKQNVAKLQFKRLQRFGEKDLTSKEVRFCVAFYTQNMIGKTSSRRFLLFSEYRDEKRKKGKGVVALSRSLFEF